MTKAEIEKRIEELECKIMAIEDEMYDVKIYIKGLKDGLTLLRQQLAELVNNQLLGE